MPPQIELTIADDDIPDRIGFAEFQRAGRPSGLGS